MDQEEQLKEKKPKTWDEAIKELNTFIRESKKETADEQTKRNDN